MKYSLAIKYFLIMNILLIISGLILFFSHTNFSLTGISNYYSPKSIYGYLEIFTPHIFAMSLVIFILTHFIAIVKSIEINYDRYFIILIFVIILITNISPFFIGEENTWFTLIKLLSLIVFILIYIYYIYRAWK